MEGPVIVCGLGRVGWNILEHLRRAGVRVTVIDENATSKDLNCTDVTFIQGDCRKEETLLKAGVASARGVLIVTSEDLINVSTALVVRRLNTDVRIVVRMFNQNLIARLGGAVKNMVALSVSGLTAPLLALTAITGQAVTALEIDKVPRQIAEVPIDGDSHLAGARLADVEANAGITVLAHCTPNAPPALWQEFDRTAKLTIHDSLMVFGPPDAVAALLAAGRGEALGGVRWAGWLRRQGRTLRRAIATVDTLVKVAMAALVFSIVGSTLVYHYAIGSGWADSFYNTVNLVATGDTLHGDTMPGWAKTFLGAMKLVGTGLVATFTALFTNYLIRARLNGALEVRRIPDSGHIVVCGLGNVGFRCIEELHKLQHPVVAIESVNDNPFAATVRRMGVPVIVGNAAIPAVLAQARAESAGAVIAATESELVNLEIALLVRETNPKQRVVVRLTEPDFAAAVRDSANIKHALSIPTLAAPAFAAALFGDRVQSLVTVGPKTLAVVELVVQANDPCFRNMLLRNAMDDFKLLPLAVKGKLLDHAMTLAAGDSVTAVLELTDLEALHIRQARQG